jgi:hypothetical protein
LEEDKMEEGLAVRGDEIEEGESMSSDSDYASPSPEDEEGNQARPRRHFAVPLVRKGRQLGVLFLDSDLAEMPGLEDQAVYGEVMSHIEAAVDLAMKSTAVPAEAPAAPPAAKAQIPMKIRRFPRNDVIFVDGEYLIKGLAGTIFWKLVRDYQAGRQEFSNLELRLELSQTHPEKAENLESRLVMLIRRLESCRDIRIERTARGKFRLVVGRPIELIEN